MKPKIALYTVLIIAVVALMSSCDKSFNEPIAPVETEQIQDEDASSLELRSSNITYYSTPNVGGTVPNSTVNIKGKGTATYHGGVLAAKLLRQNGNKFTIRISKQGGGTFNGGGIAIVTVGTVDGSVAGHKRYYPGVTHIDIEVTATFNQGAVHFYPTTKDQNSGYRYYAEPILIHTKPLYKIKSEYTYGEVLGTINGVAVKANGVKNQSKGGDHQCTTFCIRYYNSVYGKNYVHYFDAHKWYNDTKNFPDLDRYRNGGSVAPRPGNILCMSGGGGLGHVAIIMEVTGSRIKIAQQNSGIPGKVWQHAIGGELSYNPSTRTISKPDGYTIQGWMRVSLN